MDSGALIKSVEDYRVMKFVFEHTDIEPAFDDYVAADRAMGDEGIVLGEILPIPVQWLLVEIMGTPTWSEGVLLHTPEFDELLNSLTCCYKRQVEIAAESPAEVIWVPDNVTGTIMSPRLFQMYCKPIYDFACGVLRQAGKVSFAHYDGANRPLRECIAGVALDVIEAFTPPPMGGMTVAEARTGMARQGAESQHARQPFRPAGRGNRELRRPVHRRRGRRRPLHSRLHGGIRRAAVRPRLLSNDPGRVQGLTRKLS